MYDLTAEPWLPAVLRDGSTVMLSLSDLLRHAHEVRALALGDPLQEVAVFRQVLLPVVIDALGVPRRDEEYGERWRQGRFDEDRLRDYLAEHRERFDLFSEQSPFAQVAGLRTSKDETKSAALLLPAVAAGNNVPLFSNRTDADPPALSPAEAARALLAAHCWDTAAIKSGARGDPAVKAGKTTGNPTGPLGQLGVLLPLGSSLFETLMLNVPVLSSGLERQDRPQWRADPVTPAWRIRAALGLLDLLTWQARRVRLVPEVLAGETVVRRVVLSAGDRLEPLPDDVEPHTVWRQVDAPQAGRPPIAPLRHQPGRALWRGMSALLSTAGPTSEKLTSSGALSRIAELRRQDQLPVDLQLGILAVGVAYGNQSAVVEDVFVDRLPLPVPALAQDGALKHFLLEAAGQVEKVRRAANYLDDELRRAAGGEGIPWDKAPRAGDLLLQNIDPLFRRMLAGLRREADRVEEATQAWTRQLWVLAESVEQPALDAVPASAFGGRKAGGAGGRGAEPPSLAAARYRGRLREALGEQSRHQPSEAVA